MLGCCNFMYFPLCRQIMGHFFSPSLPIHFCSKAVGVTTQTAWKMPSLTGHAEQHALLLPLRDSSLLAYLKSSLQKFTASMPSLLVVQASFHVQVHLLVLLLDCIHARIHARVYLTLQCITLIPSKSRRVEKKKKKGLILLP